MIRLAIKWITAILTRLLYFMVAPVLLVALLTTIECGLPPGLSSKLAFSSQAAGFCQGGRCAGHRWAAWSPRLPTATPTETATPPLIPTSTATATPTPTPTPTSYCLSGSVVFQTDRDGNWEIYKMRYDGYHQGRLTNNEADDISPDWSPDGQEIVFASNRDGNWEVYKMRSDGYHQERLTDNLACAVMATSKRT